MSMLAVFVASSLAFAMAVLTAALCVAGIFFVAVQLSEAFAIWRSMRRRK